MDKEEGTWNIEVVGEAIPEEDRTRIEKLPICQREGPDRVIWPYNKDGSYSVRSGYLSMKGSRHVRDGNRASSSHIVSKSTWKQIWKIQAPSKIKNFLWKACQNALATYQNLWKRRCCTTPTCQLCLHQEESVEHLLLCCDWVQKVWFGSSLAYHVDRQSITSFDFWLVGIFEMSSIKALDKMIMQTRVAFICWHIWKARNAATLEKKHLNAEQVIFLAERAASEYMEIKAFKEKGCLEILLFLF
ncbi:hypothetical protein COLO4_07290 [Corchorus olitorius]|uniref:Reverse transcriptase zinc-binding domain-containing protein n=1 Tax=Corchorus olitorius TaxID=93759 RepID=A0A1R3KKJ2_9ROSI|nr:hypothetical protein COLO4_07290 [Corchorus olitorius]